MAYSYVWPASLPQNPQKGFSESGGSKVLRTSMDSGMSKTRRRGLQPSLLSLSFIMTNTQVAAFENFFNNTIKGVARFGFTHPRTGSIVETRIVPQGEYPYNLTYLAPGYWTFSIQLEVLP